MDAKIPRVDEVESVSESPGCLGILWKSKTRQRIVFGMIHLKDSLLPRGNVLGIRDELALKFFFSRPIFDKLGSRSLDSRSGHVNSLTIPKRSQSRIAWSDFLFVENFVYNKKIQYESLHSGKL